MDPLTATLVMGGVSAAGSYFTNQANAKYASDASDKQIAFQREMSNTSYQRAKEDMEAAGLNPALMYSQGGASTPQGAALNAPQENPLEQLGASAVQVASLKKDLEKKQGEIDLSHEMAATQKTQQGLNASSAKAAEANAKAATASAAKSLEEANQLTLRRNAIKAEADYSEKENKLREKTLYMDYGAEKLGQILGLSNSAKSLKNMGTRTKEIYVDPKTGEILK